MDIFKIIGVALVGAICSLVLKNTHSQYALLVTLATGLVILIICVNSLNGVILAFQEIVDKTGVDQKLFAQLLKIIGIGYLTEYSASICADLECGSIGKKLGFAGKITIFIMSLPIVKGLVEVVAALV
ncbi:MAG: SpoIIIAC/SpoIIIAD family protein [Clostridia bacterium]